MLLAYGVQHITKRLRHDGLQATQYLARLAYWHDLTDPGAYSQQPEAAPLPVLRLQLEPPRESWRLNFLRKR